MEVEMAKQRDSKLADETQEDRLACRYRLDADELGILTRDYADRGYDREYMAAYYGVAGEGVQAVVWGKRLKKIRDLMGEEWFQKAIASVEERWAEIAEAVKCKECGRTKPHA